MSVGVQSEVARTTLEDSVRLTTAARGTTALPSRRSRSKRSSPRAAAYSPLRVTRSPSGYDPGDFPFGLWEFRFYLTASISTALCNGGGEAGVRWLDLHHRLLQGLSTPYRPHSRAGIVPLCLGHTLIGPRRRSAPLRHYHRPTAHSQPGRTRPSARPGRAYGPTSRRSARTTNRLSSGQ